MAAGPPPPPPPLPVQNPVNHLFSLAVVAIELLLGPGEDILVEGDSLSLCFLPNTSITLNRSIAVDIGTVEFDGTCTLYCVYNCHVEYCTKCLEVPQPSLEVKSQLQCPFAS